MAETQLQKWIEENAPEPSPAEPVLESLLATSRGDYYPPAGVDGFDVVTVQTPYLRIFRTENGTLGDPFGDSYAEYKRIANEISSMRISVDGTAIGVGTILCERDHTRSNQNTIWFEYAVLTGNTATSAALSIGYNTTGETPVLSSCYAYMNGNMVDMSGYASMLPAEIFSNYYE